MAAIELGAIRIFVLPVGYPWLRQEPKNVLGMALQALARFIEQKLYAEAAANRGLADNQVSRPSKRRLSHPPTSGTRPS